MIDRVFANLNYFEDNLYKVLIDESMSELADSNLNREKMLPGENAFAYKLKLASMKRQGKGKLV